MRILILADYYLPAYKAGGALRTLANLVENLGDEFEFRIATRDRDAFEPEPFPGIRTGAWQRVGKAEVLYLPPSRQGLRGLREVLCSTPHDVLYLNSFFSPVFTLQPLLLQRLRLVPQRPVVLAPQGEFSPGALELKAYKKRGYVSVARLLGLYRPVFWLVSSLFEAADVQRGFGPVSRLHVAPAAMAPEAAAMRPPRRAPKQPGALRAVFLSRITEKKNLLGALHMLEGLQGEIEFAIYGPIEERDYWQRCEAAMRSLPRNVRAHYAGVVPHEKVHEVLEAHDLFFFPTAGENFGHVILEALLAGCPVLLSDRTPWRGLEQEGGGWDLPLEQPDRFTAVLQECIRMDQRQHERLVERARVLGRRFAEDEAAVEQNRVVFLAAARSQTDPAGPAGSAQRGATRPLAPNPDSRATKPIEPTMNEARG